MKILIGCCVVLSVYLIGPAYGQWTTQTIELEMGWNAVFLDLEPYPPESALQFGGLPIERVWLHRPRFFTEQFIRNPEELVSEMPAWRLYLSPESPGSFATDLHRLQAGRAYLIKATQAVTWTVVGRPRIHKPDWNPDTYNLTGFPVDPLNPPTFGRWFESSPAHHPLDVWTLDPDGTWHQLSNPATSPIEAGKAYWVFTNGTSDFEGPVRMDIVSTDGLTFPPRMIKRRVRIQHIGSGPRNVTIGVFPSSPVPPIVPDSAAELTPMAGNVVLTHLKRVDDGTRFRDYVDFPAVFDYPDGYRLPYIIEIAIARRRMQEPPSGDAIYQSIMVIRDNRGFRRLVPVTAEPRSPPPSQATKQRLAAKGLATLPDDAGLWTGVVTVHKVSEPSFLFTDPEVRKGVRLPNTGHEALTPAPLGFTFPVIVHIDETGVARLLNEVTFLYRQPITQQDPNDPEMNVVIEDGRVVLMTADAPDALVNQVGGLLVGSTLRDGRSFAHRITTPMFSLRNAEGNPESPIMVKAGSIYDTSAELSINLRLEDDDPLNPFHHQYHAMHRYYTAEDVVTDLQRYNIDRSIVLTFTGDQEPPDGLVQPGVGDDQVCGVYQESLLGLRHDPIFVEGYFRLYRASSVSVLNDGLGFAQ